VRLFLDTNVLVSALTTRGLCSEILETVIDSHELLISEALLEELRRVLTKKFQAPPSVTNGFLALLKKHGRMTRPIQDCGVNLKDSDDLPILGAAMAGNADALVTGDKELLALGRPGTLVIVSPREFWGMLGLGG
jgi:putative PIN family toxin of toxin-antitoxin system